MNFDVSCETCRFASQAPVGYTLVCKRYPPVARMTVDGILGRQTLITAQPEVSPSTVCGEWQADASIGGDK